jgi:hypothetical protein
MNSRRIANAAIASNMVQCGNISFDADQTPKRSCRFRGFNAEARPAASPAVLVAFSAP